MLIEFDPDVISYEEILEHMMAQHSPTQPPYSRQYRSAILVYTQEQLRIANETVKLMTSARKQRIYTDIEDANTTIFYKAEEYHQKYIEKEQMSRIANGLQGYGGFGSC